MADPSALVDTLFADTARYGTTYAAVVVRGDEVLSERYGGEITHEDGQDEPVGPDTPLLSWSVAKSVLHAAVGVVVGGGRLALDMPAPVPEWADADDPRHAITLEHLLCMRDGLAFVEDYVDDRRSDVIKMLFGNGRDDVAQFAADRPLAHEPGSTFNYSSGSSNIEMIKARPRPGRAAQQSPSLKTRRRVSRSASWARRHRAAALSAR